MRTVTLLLVLLALSLNGCAPSQFGNMPVASPTDPAQVENTWPPTVSIASVTTSDGQSIYFPQMSYANQEEARYAGELELKDGCLYLVGELILWPPAYRLDVAEDAVQIVNDVSGDVLQIGDYIVSSGGVADSSSLPTVIVALEQQLPETCDIDKVVWIGGSVKKTDATE